MASHPKYGGRGDLNFTQGLYPVRVPVISADNISLMPTKPSRARRWIKTGKAIAKFNKLGIFYVQLIVDPSGVQTQEIVIGLDRGKMFSGVAVQSQKYTLQMLHLVFEFQNS
ncbi:RRXRR domain-containing protein [Nostoc sp.]